MRPFKAHKDSPPKILLSELSLGRYLFTSTVNLELVTWQALAQKALAKRTRRRHCLVIYRHEFICFFWPFMGLHWSIGKGLWKSKKVKAKSMSIFCWKMLLSPVFIVSSLELSPNPFHNTTTTEWLHCCLFPSDTQYRYSKEKSFVYLLSYSHALPKVDSFHIFSSPKHKDTLYSPHIFKPPFKGGNIA